MKKLKKDERLFFYKEHAIKFGVDAAILLQHFQFWITNNKKSGTNFKDGRTWTYSTQEKLKEKFPFWSVRQIQRIIKNLVKQKAILVRKYDDDKTVRTNWYTFNNESDLITPSGVLEDTKQWDETPQAVSSI